MAETLTYKVQKYTEDIKNIFKGVYNDFKNKAYSEYKFELEPEYLNFTNEFRDWLKLEPQTILGLYSIANIA